ncbi:hypothetical protein L873DRAFT_1790476 [Choiromyces venosus 120613-1]|uniref:Uncharacterized protein n=1 Tax=Choiromyces venosus 120613-1 TaxID=1336337 RepID=A0A3N4JIP5_9PEZI|nr:hypothetical protein L873DRAFT_1790476 [Choiromyces venosus 120613-1]
MPAISPLPIDTLLSQLSKRDNAENKVQSNSNGDTTGVIVGVVIAGLTLLVGIMSLQNSGLGHWAFSFLSPSRFFESRNSSQQQASISASQQRLSAAPSVEFLKFGSFGFVFVFNFYTNAHAPSSHGDTSSYSNNGTSSEVVGVTQVEEVPESVEPERVISWSGSEQFRVFQPSSATTVSGLPTTLVPTPSRRVPMPSGRPRRRPPRDGL